MLVLGRCFVVNGVGPRPTRLRVEGLRVDEDEEGGCVDDAQEDVVPHIPVSVLADGLGFRV